MGSATERAAPPNDFGASGTHKNVTWDSIKRKGLRSAIRSRALVVSFTSQKRWESTETGSCCHSPPRLAEFRFATVRLDRAKPRPDRLFLAEGPGDLIAQRPSQVQHTVPSPVPSRSRSHDIDQALG